MGDNRSNSQDSRYHESQKPGDGMVPVGNVIGRAVLVVWPYDHWTTLPVPSTFDDIRTIARPSPSPQPLPEVAPGRRSAQTRRKKTPSRSPWNWSVAVSRSARPSR